MWRVMECLYLPEWIRLFQSFVIISIYASIINVNDRTPDGRPALWRRCRDDPRQPSTLCICGS